MKTVLTLTLSMFLAFSGFAAARCYADAGIADLADAGAVTADAGAKIVADAGPIVTPDDAGQYIGAVIDATHKGSWRLLAALVIVGAVWVTRRYGAKKVAWLATKWGGVTLALAYGVLAQVAVTLAGHDPITGKLLLDGAIQGVLASGAWSMIKGFKKADAPATPVT